MGSMSKWKVAEVRRWVCQAAAFRPPARRAASKLFLSEAVLFLKCTMQELVEAAIAEAEAAHELLQKVTTEDASGVRALRPWLRARCLLQLTY